MDKWEFFTAVDCTLSPALKLNYPLVEYFLFTAEPAAELAAVLVAEFIAELVAKPIALLSNYSKIQLFLFLLTYNTSSNFITVSSLQLFLLQLFLLFQVITSNFLNLIFTSPYYRRTITSTPFCWAITRPPRI